MTYHQASGKLRAADGALMGVGYSGRDSGKNNPKDQGIAGFGPIPCGKYAIGKPFNSDTHGPFVLPLTPVPGAVMYGRSGFLIHGDSKSAPGTASHGCIILPRKVREAIAASGDTWLTVEV